MKKDKLLKLQIEVGHKDQLIKDGRSFILIKLKKQELKDLIRNLVSTSIDLSILDQGCQ